MNTPLILCLLALCCLGAAIAIRHIGNKRKQVPYQHAIYKRELNQLKNEMGRKQRS